MLTCAIPTLDAAATLEETLRSLRGQFGVHAVIIDSGSTDGTLDIAARFGIPVRFVERGNMYRAVNAGLIDATTPWLTYLNADDLVQPGAFAKLVRLGADVAYGDCDFIDAGGRYLSTFLSADPPDLLALYRAGVQGLPQPATIFTRELFATLGGFNTDYRFAADADFFLRALQHGARFARLPEPVCTFRLHASQQTVTHGAEMAAEIARVTEAAGGTSMKARLAFARWRLRNAGNYAARFVRTGRLRLRERPRVD